MNKLIRKFNNLGENDKIVYRNVLGAFLVKGGALFVSLYTLPAYISFFNNDEVLGVWYTVLSVLNWILNFDLGIGNGLRNHLSASLSNEDRENTKKYISSAYISVGIIVVLMSLVFVIVAKFVDFNNALSIEKDTVSSESLYIAVIIVFVGAMIQFWLRLISSILYALQKSSVNNFLVLITNIIILFVAKVYPSGSNDNNVIVMAIVHAVAVAMPLLGASFIVFLGKLRYAFPRVKFVTKKHTKDVLVIGGVFFFVQIAYMIIMSTNEFLITKTTGNTYVVEYQAYYKLFSLGSTVFALALIPVWSVITKAKAERNYSWINKTYRKFMLLAAVFCVGEFAIIPLMKAIASIWLGEANIGYLNIQNGFIFALLGCCMIVNGVLSSIANGLGELKTQAICFGFGAIVKIPLSFILTDITNSWIGVVVANIICVGVYCIIQPICFKKCRIENIN